jgi:hypothetical protein
MSFDSEERQRLVLSIWQAITLVGDARERLQEVEASELDASLAEVESLPATFRSPGMTPRRYGPLAHRRALRGKDSPPRGG